MAIFVKKNDADSCPKGEDGGNPDADVETVALVVKKPKANAQGEADESSSQEVVIEFGEHGSVLRCRSVALKLSRFLVGKAPKNSKKNLFHATSASLMDETN